MSSLGFNEISPKSHNLVAGSKATQDFVRFYSITALLISVFSIAASVAVVYKFARRGAMDVFNTKSFSVCGPQSMTRFMDGVVMGMGVVDTITALMLVCCVTVSWQHHFFEGTDNRWMWWAFAQLCFLPQFYHCYIAYVTHAWVVRGQSVLRLQRNFRGTVNAIVGLVIGNLLLQMMYNSLHLNLGTHSYNYKDCPWAKTGYVQYLVIACIVQAFIFTMHLRTCVSLGGRAMKGQRVQRAYRKIVSRLVKVCVVSFVVWTCWTAVMFMWYTGWRKHMSIMMIMSLVVFLYPLLDAVILGNIFTRTKKAAPRPITVASQTVKVGESRAPVALQHQGSTSQQRSASSVFATTYNAGDVKDVEEIAQDLNTWIPQGYDIYCIGLQECSVVDELRGRIHQYLGGNSAYRMFQAQVAQANVLYGSIALTIYARTSDVVSGAFCAIDGVAGRVRNGVDLGVVKAGNKGVVGLAFRYFDTTVAVITAHLASDSAGKQRLTQRNDGAAMALRQLCLSDEEGFDVQLEHHHTILMGDLNYRIKMDAREMVERVVRTASISKTLSSLSERGHEGVTWVQSNYLSLFNDNAHANAVDSLKQRLSRGPQIRSVSGVSLTNIEEDHEDMKGDMDDVDIESQTPTQTPTHPHPAAKTKANSNTSTNTGLAGVQVPGLQWLKDALLIGGEENQRNNSVFVDGSQADQTGGGADEDDDEDEEEEGGGNPWDWINHFDELNCEMAAGRVFSGFREGSITFPPSFRRVPGADAGDYTEVDRVAQSYVLVKKGDGQRVPSYTDRIVFHSLPDVQQDLSLVAYQMCDSVNPSDHRPVAAAFTLSVNKKVLGFGSVHLNQTQSGSYIGPNPKKLSPARSTSLLKWLKPSDGSKDKDKESMSRQMSATQVEEDNHSSSSGSAAGRTEDVEQGNGNTNTNASTPKRNREPKMEPTLAGPPTEEKEYVPSIWSLRISNLAFQYAAGIGDGQPSQDWQVTLQFPCPLEDPLAQERKARDLEEAIEGQSGGHENLSRGMSSFGSLRKMSSLRTSGSSIGELAKPSANKPTLPPEMLIRTHHAQWKTAATEKGMGIKVAVVPEFSRHALIRIANSKGEEIAQGVVCIRQAVASQDQAPQQARMHRLMGGARQDNGTPSSTIDVAMTSAGRKVGTLSLAVRVRKRAYTMQERDGASVAESSTRGGSEEV